MQERSGGAVILLAEDEPVVRNFVRAALSSAGYYVLAACDGAEALRLSRAYEGVIDLVLSDVKMPNMTGPDLEKMIKKERPDTPVILMTGKSSNEVPHHLRPEMLRKPFLSKELLRRVEAKLGQRSDYEAV
jgi:DNA-binding response OmpR family regulator